MKWVFGIRSFLTLFVFFLLISEQEVCLLTTCSNFTPNSSRFMLYGSQGDLSKDLRRTHSSSSWGRKLFIISLLQHTQSLKAGFLRSLLFHCHPEQCLSHRRCFMHACWFTDKHPRSPKYIFSSLVEDGILLYWPLYQTALDPMNFFIIYIYILFWIMCVSIQIDICILFLPLQFLKNHWFSLSAERSYTIYTAFY